MRISLACWALTALIGALGCSKLGIGDDKNPTAPSGPPDAGSAIVYSAVGASDVSGYNSSQPCGIFEDCNGTGYPWVAARQLRTQGFSVTVYNRGIPSAVLSPRIEQIALQYSIDVPGGNIVARSAPFIRNNSTLVTAFAGANDVNVVIGALAKGAGGTDPVLYIDQTVAGFASDYRDMIDAMRSQASGARIVVLNLPNMAGTPYLASATLPHKQAAQRLSVRMTTTAINTLSGVTVIDLMCDARFYQRATYSSDGFHLSDTGNSYIGAEIVRALTESSYPAPPSNCPQMSLY
ncbi:MAG: SGNH/GDSL hydrolase family protein [Vicinamibacterales bacterium]